MWTPTEAAAMRRRRFLHSSLCAGTAVFLAGCGGSEVDRMTTLQADSSLQLSSPSFDDGGTYPTRFTADGDDVSPPLRTEGVPEDADALVLIVDDVDAPGGEAFTHWLLWDVPPGTTKLPANIRPSRRVSALDGAKQGNNSFGELGYRGPSPPGSDDAHTYRFTLFAMASAIDVQAGADRSQLSQAMDGKALASTRITAEYDR